MPALFTSTSSRPYPLNRGGDVAAWCSRVVAFAGDEHGVLLAANDSTAASSASTFRAVMHTVRLPATNRSATASRSRDWPR